MSEMDKDASKVLVVFLNSMIESANMGLVQKAQHLFLELPAPFAGNDFDQINLLVDCLLHNPIQFGVDLIAAVVDVV